MMVNKKINEKVKAARNICVFCGANRGRHPAYAEMAYEVGQLLVHKGLGLVYGGCSIGLMGILADSVVAGGGVVHGVMPKVIADREVTHTGPINLHMVDSMHQRKQLMYELADAFLALPGGVGTLEELTETLTWFQLGLHKKPCAILNIQ
ncbi:MAG: TIGR00730 family Rossman fold protein, partial [Oligoflexia bacterium]|nr:TIGR00730 family Rossman fold protein [Oligoflexia bacterium]